MPLATAPHEVFSRGSPLQIAPDGRTVLYTVQVDDRSQLVRRRLDTLEPQPVAGASGGGAAFFSPDGRSLAVWDPSGTVRTMPVEGGAGGLTVVEDVFVGLHWEDDGFLYFTPTARGETYLRDSRCGECLPPAGRLLPRRRRGPCRPPGHA